MLRAKKKIKTRRDKKPIPFVKYAETRWSKVARDAEPPSAGRSARDAGKVSATSVHNAHRKHTTSFKTPRKPSTDNAMRKQPIDTKRRPL